MVDPTPQMSDAKLAEEMMPWVVGDYSNALAYELLISGWKVYPGHITPPPATVVKENVRRRISAMRARPRPNLP